MAGGDGSVFGAACGADAAPAVSAVAACGLRPDDAQVLFACACL